MTRNRQIIAATVILAHHASVKPAEETMFWMVPRDRTPKNVPMMLPTPPESIVPPMMDAAMAFISMPSALVTAPEAECMM